MPLESASYIHQLETSNPAPTDLLRQADDHIRLIKAVLKSTFPNVTGPVTASHTALSSLFAEPIGTIKMWYGSEAQVPSGYALCHGQTLARSDGAGNITLPDMRDKVPIGVGTLATLGASHGAASASGSTGSAGAHTHNAGAHTHGFTVSGTSGSTPVTVSVSETRKGVEVSNPGGDALDHVTASGAAHTHTISVTGTTDSAGSSTTSSDGAHTHPVTGVSTYQPAVGIHFIMKV